MSDMGLPDWLSIHQNERTPALSPEGKALMFVQFEMVLPRILEQVCAGVTVTNAIKALQPLVNVDVGAFMHWLKKNPKNYALLKEAKEVRTEVWAGKMIDHATGIGADGFPSENDVSRDKLAVDTYWKLMGAENKNEFGDTKTIEISGGISITAALSAGRSRVIEAQVIHDDVDLLNNRQIRELSAAPVDEEDEDN